LFRQAGPDVEEISPTGRYDIPRRSLPIYRAFFDCLEAKINGESISVVLAFFIEEGGTNFAGGR
jgi:hypothetical protein